MPLLCPGANGCYTGRNPTSRHTACRSPGPGFCAHSETACRMTQKNRYPVLD